MGVVYYRVKPTTLEALRASIETHESDVLGPRARGYWFDYPENYDYDAASATAQALDEAGQREGSERLELSEVEAHALSQLEIKVPEDEQPFSPALFLNSAHPELVRLYVRMAQRAFGPNGEKLFARMSSSSRDPRIAGYVGKLVRHLREATPKVLALWENAAQAGDAVLVVDLRARDVYIPEAIEVMDSGADW